MSFDVSPPVDCQICPRLAAYRAANRLAYPDFRNAPVESLGDAQARLAIVGLAPGLRGANRTGRPFTGDYAGDLLYATLLEFGFARGVYDRRPDDGLVLVDSAIVNAVRCVPPENKPTPAEIAACRPYLAGGLRALPRLTAIVALGRIAHDSALKALELRGSQFPFAHAARHSVARPRLALFDSYHCSRYNTNTGRLTVEMFRAVFAAARAHLDAAPD
ncbi:MAG: uracil-DNA glycosylase [Bradyrhizobium sp.]|nr:MAG: uracil-DNA glycosylase [Bradyrhizobium sp.]